MVSKTVLQLVNNVGELAVVSCGVEARSFIPAHCSLSYYRTNLRILASEPKQRRLEDSVSDFYE